MYDKRRKAALSAIRFEKAMVIFKKYEDATYEK